MRHTPSDLARADTALHTVEVPEYWSPEQALAVWELLNELADQIWQRYETPMVALIRADLEPERNDNHDQPDLFDPDDCIPF